MRSEISTRKVSEPSESDGEKIVVGQMAQRNEVWKEGDDWTGLTDSQQRRKLQNRLNQRLWRKRHQASNSIRKRKKELSKAVDQDSAGSSASIKTESDKSTSPEMMIRDIPPSARSTTPPDTTTSFGSTELDRKNSRVPIRYGMDPIHVRKLLTAVEAGALDEFMLGCPRVDRLLTLIQYNVFRGLISNTSTMGFNMSWLDCTDISPYYNSRDPPATCPVHLRPTALQRKVDHHPWIDLFPFPQMRDNLLLQGEDFDDEPLCRDLVEFTEMPQEKSGLILWGEPHDPAGWEVSEEFAKRWTWMIKGCWDLMESTNRWRRKRGERPLFNPNRVQEIRDRSVYEIE